MPCKKAKSNGLFFIHKPQATINPNRNRRNLMKKLFLASAFLILSSCSEQPSSNKCNYEVNAIINEINARELMIDKMLNSKDGIFSYESSYEDGVYMSHYKFDTNFNFDIDLIASITQKCYLDLSANIDNTDKEFLMGLGCNNKSIKLVRDKYAKYIKKQKKFCLERELLQGKQ
jgi:hypothetical protein